MMKQLSKFQRGSSMHTQFGGLRLIACFRCFSTFFRILEDLRIPLESLEPLKRVVIRISRIFYDISCAVSPAFSPTFSPAFLPHFLPQFLPHFPRSSPAFLPHFLQHFSRFVLMGVKVCQF